jgi:hypothetical protein
MKLRHMKGNNTHARNTWQSKKANEKTYIHAK